MDLSLITLLRAYHQNKDLVTDYLNSKHTKENYNFQTFQASAPAVSAPVVQPNGDVVHPNGAVVHPDGVVVHPNGAVVHPNGDIVHPNGVIVRPNGVVVPPGSGVVPGTNDDKKIMGLAVGVFVFVLLVVLALYIWAIATLVMNWNKIDTWVKAVSLLLLFLPGLHIPFSPVIVILLVKFDARQ